MLRAWEGQQLNNLEASVSSLYRDLPQASELKVLCLIFVILNCLVFFKVFISS